MTPDSRSGSHYLRGAVDCHVHPCPHVGARSVTVFEAVRQAAAAGMRGIGLMDTMANTSGYAALAMKELGHLGVEVFGGVIMQPVAGGITVETARTALAYGYGPGTGARYVSLPSHNTRFFGALEGRSEAEIEPFFFVPERGPVPDPVPEIMDRVAEADAVFDCGHVSGREALALVREGRRRGLRRLRTHAFVYAPDEIRALVAEGAYAEFSYFYLSPASRGGFRQAGGRIARYPHVSLADMAERIRAATPERAIVSTDCGQAVLPPPVEAFREFLVLLESSGFSEAEIRLMSALNPAELFRVGSTR